MHKVLAELITEEAVTNVDIFSDGSSSQFKNQYVFNFLSALRELHKLESLNWHFFATSHGKGAVDGIGGTVKRNVWMETLSRKAVVNTLEDFCKVSAEKEQSVCVIPVPVESIQTCASEIGLEESFASSSAVKGIKKIHHVAALSDGKIQCKEYSCKEVNGDASEEDESDELSSDLDEWYDGRCTQLAAEATSIIRVDDFVVCMYEGELFPGQVTNVLAEGKGASIKVLGKCAGGWRWPNHKDEIEYPSSDSIQHINHPEPINNRGTYRIAELEDRWGSG